MAATILNTPREGTGQPRMNTDEPAPAGDCAVRDQRWHDAVSRRGRAMASTLMVRHTRIRPSSKPTTPSAAIPAVTSGFLRADRRDSTLCGVARAAPRVYLAHAEAHCAVPRKASGRTTPQAIRQAMVGATGRATQPATVRATSRTTDGTTRVATCSAPERVTGETTDQGLREVTAETTLRTMYETTMYVASRVARGTMYEATLSATSSTTWRVVPWAGVSVSRLQA